MTTATNQRLLQVQEFGRQFKTVFGGHSIVMENQILQEVQTTKDIFRKIKCS